MTKFGVGQAIKRVEDQALVTGGGQYTDDVNIEGQAHAFILRSPQAHARILSIDTSAAAAAPGVLTVLTGTDVEADGLGGMPCNVAMKSRDGSDRADTPHPILARDKVRYGGEPVALVVAETLHQARDAAELIAVEYEELEPSVDTFGATEEGAALVWDHIPANTAFDWEKGDQSAVDEALGRAHHVTKLRLVNNRVVVNAMEPRAALADYDPATDKSTLYTPTQGPHVIYGQIADAILGIGKEKLRIVTGHVGGGFGMKVFLHPEQPLIVWASRKLKRAVKWTADRSEGFVSDLQGRDHVSFAELALAEDGAFLGLKVTTYAALGAYLSNFAPYVVTGGNDMLVGLYDQPAIYINVKGVVTNTVPVDAYRGAGRPEAAYLIERLVDKAAREMGMTPDAIRRRNFIKPEQMPYATCLGDTYDSGEFEAVMDKAMANADWAGFEARRADSARHGKLRGIG
ncbi:MAG: xanthine dehydrogenase family protein molybdopterin-binding subunit, partial [Bauldia litoralis]